jgi:hypothetical protein
MNLPRPAVVAKLIVTELNKDDHSRKNPTLLDMAQARPLLVHLNFSRAPRSEACPNIPFLTETFTSFDKAIAKFMELRKDPTFTLLCLAAESFGCETSHADGRHAQTESNVILGEIRKFS